MALTNDEKEKLANELFKDCALFASQFFELPRPLAIGMENYSEQRFHHPLTTSVTIIDKGEIIIIFNRDWVYKSIEEHADDVQFFILHELRHSNQFIQIIQAEHGEQTAEPAEVVMQWKQSFSGYTLNEGDEVSQRKNLSQVVVQDAYAYAFALHDLLHRNDIRYEYLTSLPQEVAGSACVLAEHYKRTKPELKRYIDGYRIYNPGRNDLCPCGSGLKFKKCHIGKGIYDK